MSSRPLRVLFFSRAPFVSGAERALVTLLKGLDRSRVEPAVVVGSEMLSSDLSAAEVPFLIVPLVKRELSGLWSWWRSASAIRAAIRRFRPDVVHANDVPSCQAMSMIAGSLGIPRVVHIRWPVDSNGFRWWSRGGAEQILCISRWIADELGQMPPGCQVSIDPDPITWSSSPEVDDRLRQPDDPIVLGFAGQLIPVKGLDRLLQALGSLESPRRFRLLVAGEDRQTHGAYAAHLQQLAIEVGLGDQVEWMGFLQNVEQLYTRIDAVVCPSLVEPLGLVPLEAARFSLPAIVSDVGGFPETVDHQATGWLVPPTVEGWRHALETLPGPDALRECGRRARRRIAETHDLHAYCNRLTEMYERLRLQSSGKSPFWKRRSSTTELAANCLSPEAGK